MKLFGRTTNAEDNPAGFSEWRKVKIRFQGMYFNNRWLNPILKWQF